MLRTPSMLPRSRRAKIGTLDDADGDHQLPQTRSEQGDEPDREQEAGERQHDVDEPHDHRVDDAAEVPGERRRAVLLPRAPGATETIATMSETRAPKMIRDNTSRPRASSPSQWSAVGPGQQRPPRRSRYAATRRRLGCEERREQGDDDHEADDAGADEGAGVAPQPQQDVAAADRRRGRRLVERRADDRSMVIRRGCWDR